MFSQLVESRPKHVRRPAGAVASFLAHYGLILVGVYTSAHAGTVDERPRVEQVTWVEPTKAPEPPESQPPELSVAPRPVRTDPVLTAPIEIPNVLPEIDLSRPLTDPSAFIRPTPPVSPRRSGEAGEGPDTAIYVISQVERPATHAPNSAAPPYPDILRQAGVEGEVLVSFVVDTSGRVDPTTVKVIRTTHELFAAAVKNALPRMRFIPAEVGERKVRQLVQQPYSFAIVK